MLKRPSRLAESRRDDPRFRRRFEGDEPEAEKGFCEKCHRLQQKFSLLVGMLAAFTAFLAFNAGRPGLDGPLTQLAALFALSAASMFAASRFYPAGKPLWFWPSYAAALAALVFGVMFFIFDYAELVCGGPAANPFAVIVGGEC